jgi:hypothetical protein
LRRGIEIVRRLMWERVEVVEGPRIALREFSTKGCANDLSEITYYVGLETIVAREDTDGLPRWLVVLFAAIYRNAAHVTDECGANGSVG